MILGIGSDLVDIRRIERAMKRHGARFAERIFTEGERAYCAAQKEPARAFAKRFAAKEATAKALGSGFRGGLALADIEVVRDSQGKPSLNLKNRASLAVAELLPPAAAPSLHLTMTDEYPYAQAFVILTAIPGPI